MRWSIASLWFAAFFAALNLAATGCAGPQWPKVQAQADGQFASRPQGVRTIDILPADLQVWTEPDQELELANMAARIDALVNGTTLAALSKRGYHVVAQMDWDGKYIAPNGEPRQAMEPEQIALIAHSLSGYGHAVAEANQGLLVPYLPHRLGTETGADATLYVGGWAFVGEPQRDSTGEKVAKGIAIGILVVAVVGVLVLAAKSSGSGGGGSGAGKIAGAAGRVAVGAGRVAVTAGRTAGRVLVPVLRGAARAGAHVFRTLPYALDAFGRTATHIHIYSGRPEYYVQDSTPKRGPSSMQMEMTLVDNRTGMVLWHARQHFPAHATSASDVRKVFDLMLAGLPAN